ncbi:MAG: HIT domain-containing protein [bacterium]|nr:HIT domain-containing protein [bacterium]
MERIWAPWRRAYVEAGGGDGCIFCEKPARGDDRAAHIVRRGRTCFSMLNRFPYNGGHMMVAPFRHAASLDALVADELAELFAMVRDSISLLAGKVRPDGFNVGMNLGRAAGAGVAGHLHVHVVPRWDGDTNFMPVAAGVKVIPQSLDEMHALLTVP